MSPNARDLIEAGSAVLLLLGTVGLVRAVRTAKAAARAALWPTVPGVVRHSKVRKGHSKLSDGNYKGRMTVVYRAQVTYAYRVSGVHFEGTRVRFGAPSRDGARGSMQDVVARYPVDQSVPVHYCPERPADSVLELGLDPFWRKAATFSVVAFLIGLGLGVALLIG